jgi:diacylglycerol kinase (ATP)
MAGRVCLIANPAAGRGRGARLLPAARAAFAAVGAGDVLVTAGAGDEADLARRALGRGFTTLAVLGGDGTWSKVAAAVAEERAECRLALLAAGTGNDFEKSLGVPAHDFAAMARMALDGADVRVDMARVDRRLFLNIAGFGFDAAVLESTTRYVGRLRGDALYVCTALRQLFGYRGVEVDTGDGAGMRRLLVLALANGRYFGGAFRIAPDASLADGLLDAVAIADAAAPGRARLFAAAMRGRHTRLPEVTQRRASVFALRFRQPPVYQADGELLAAASATVEVACVPAAVRMVTAGADATATSP